MSGHHGEPRALAAIAVFKFLKSALLIAVAIALLRLREPAMIDRATHWLATWPLATGHEQVHRLIVTLSGLESTTAILLAAIAAGYALLFAIEGYGLWQNANWAKYLTVVATALAVPLEIYELVQRFTAIRLLALAINIAILVYLIVMLRRRDSR